MKNVEFCTSAASNGTHVALSQYDQITFHFLREFGRLGIASWPIWFAAILVVVILVCGRCGCTPWNG